MQEFCNLDNASRERFSQECNFYENNLANKGIVHYRLAQYKEAQSILEVAVKDSSYDENLNVRSILGHIYENFGNADQAIEQFQYCYDRLRLIYRNQPHPNVAKSLDNLGSVYKSKDQ